jgi:hypothetical protein
VRSFGLEEFPVKRRGVDFLHTSVLFRVKDSWALALRLKPAVGFRLLRGCCAALIMPQRIGHMSTYICNPSFAGEPDFIGFLTITVRYRYCIDDLFNSQRRRVEHVRGFLQLLSDTEPIRHWR